MSFGSISIPKTRIDNCPRLRRRDETEARRRERKEVTNLDRKSSVNERLQERKQKETATMEMYVDAAPLSIALYRRRS